jgi:hypothetical protein
MRKHYRWEVGLLIALSLSAASLASDNHLYEVVFNAFHLCGDIVDGKWSTDKECLEISITCLRLYAFGITITLIAANIFKYLHSERNILEALTKSLYATFFSRLPIEQDTSLFGLTLPDSIYRVTCYKRVTFSYLPLIITPLLIVTSFLLMHLALRLPIFWSISFLTFPTGIYFVLLLITDNWWYHFSKRLTLKDRRLQLRCDYLLGYCRYGKENGKDSIKPTNLPFKIDSANNIYRMFVGSVAFNDRVNTCDSLNNHNINEYLSEISLHESELHGLKKLIEKPIEENIAALENITIFHQIEDNKKQHIKDFMISTNTAAWDLFNINGKKHCNHFVGFKVWDKGKLWGVVTIDVLDETIVNNNPKNFYQILNNNADINWLKFNLESYSLIFSKVVNPGDH